MADHASSTLTKIVSALLVTVTLSGGVWVGNIQTRLLAAETEITKSETDHDKIIKIESAQETIKEDVKEIKDDQKEILDAVNQLIRESRNTN